MYIDKDEVNEKFGYFLYEPKEDDFNYDSRYEENERESFEKYNGSYAQDYERLSDQFIDEALSGDPDAYWNID